MIEEGGYDNADYRAQILSAPFRHFWVAEATGQSEVV
jgi:hypothetical protein